MLTHASPTRVDSNGQAIGNRNRKEDSITINGGNTLRRLWRRPLRLPPRLPPDEKGSNGSIGHVSENIHGRSKWIARQQKVKESFMHAWSPTANQGWCVSKPEASNQALQANIDYAYSQCIDCKHIQLSEACFEPNTLRALATYAMSTYCQAMGCHDFNSDFSHSAVLTSINPSDGNCKM